MESIQSLFQSRWLQFGFPDEDGFIAYAREKIVGMLVANGICPTYKFGNKIVLSCVREAYKEFVIDKAPSIGSDELLLCGICREVFIGYVSYYAISCILCRIASCV